MRPLPGALALVGALALSAPAGSAEITAAPLPDTLQWFASATVQHEFIHSDLPQWTDWTSARVLLVASFPGGALGGEAFRAERFGRHAAGFLVDGYAELWLGAYANLRLRTTPGADILPRVDVRGELFQALSQGWELSASYWRMHFRDEDVDVVGAGLARYTGSWYLRGVATVSRLAGRSTLSAALTARRYFDPPHAFVELAGGAGREAVVLAAGPVVETRNTRFFQARIQQFFSERLGVILGLSYNRFEGTPARKGLTLGTMARF